MLLEKRIRVSCCYSLTVDVELAFHIFLNLALQIANRSIPFLSQIKFLFLGKQNKLALISVMSTVIDKNIVFLSFVIDKNLNYVEENGTNTRRNGSL